MSQSDKHRELNHLILKQTVYALVQEALTSAKGQACEAPSSDAASPGSDGTPSSGETLCGMTIEYGVPVPQTQSVRRWKDIYDKMESGASFVAKLVDARSFAYAATKFGGRTVTRTVTGGKDPTARVWLVQKGEQPTV
jgi:hypothetical protein